MGSAEVAAAADFAVVSSFLRLLGPAAQLPPHHAPALQQALHDTHEVPEFLKELYFKLLRRALKNFRPHQWEKSLIKFCHQRGNRQDAWELERFGYKKSNVQVKLRVLKCLLEYQFVCNVKFKGAVNKMENKDLRLNPVGRDDKGRCYWIQRDDRANVRLYREDQDEETWELIASDREGLVKVIAALKDGKNPVDSTPEPVLNEDSNSVGSPYIPMTNSENEIKDESSSAPVDVNPKISDENMKEDPQPSCETPKDNAETNETDDPPPSAETDSDAKPSEMETSESVAENIPTEESPADLNKSEDVSDCVGEEKVEELMIIKGEGSGADCESLPFPYFSEEIVEDVVYFYGSGSGRDCEAGNPNAASKSAGPILPPFESVDEEYDQDLTLSGDYFSEAIEEEVMYFYGEGSGYDCATGNPKTDDAEDARDLSAPNSDRSDDVVAQNPPDDLETDCEDGAEENGTDSKAKAAQSAPLPVTKRFLQNIPKSNSNSDSDTASNKTKLWSVDSLCGSSDPSESGERRDSATNEAVLVDKNNLLDNKSSVMDASTNSTLENNCKIDSAKSESDEVSNNTETEEIALTSAESKDDTAPSGSDDAADSTNEPVSQTEILTPVLKDNTKSDETEISNKSSKVDSEESIESESVDAVKIEEPSNKSPIKHKAESEVDSSDTIPESKSPPKKLKLEDENVSNLESLDNLKNSQKIIKFDDDRIKKDSDPFGNFDPINDYDEFSDKKDDLDDEFCQSMEDTNGVIPKIDESIKTESEIPSSKVAEEEVKVVDEKVEVVEEKIKVVEEKVEVAEEKVKGIEAKVEDVNEKVEAVEEKVEVVDKKVEVEVKAVEVEVATPNVKRTRRSENLKDTKLSDLIKKADNELFSNVHKSAKKPNVVDKKTVAANSKESDSKKETKGLKRGRDESGSESEVEELETQKNKKVKTKQKILNKKQKKKVENAPAEQDSSSEEEAETANAKDTKKSSPTTKKAKPESHSGKFKKRASKKKGSKSKTKENSTEQPEEDAPIRQSRRIAQLKIKEEAQRRLMEENALRELKEKHKKTTGKEKVDKDWEQDPSDVNSSEEEKNVKRKKVNKGDQWQKKMLGWNSSSGGNETDSEPDGGEPEDDFDEQEEEDILAHKSDHEFSPESEVEGDDLVPVRRARTLKKEDGDAAEDPDAACVHCGKADHPEWILLCDSCDAGWHASCLKPVLFLIPEGEWFCPPCNHKKLISALEEQLEEYDDHVKEVEIEDSKRKKSNQSLEKIKDTVSEEASEESESGETSSEESGSSSSSSSDDEKIYRLRERRQLPISYRFKEYDQLICSAIKEEYKEDDNGGAGNQGRGKDISTIIEADKEEKKLQAAQAEDEEVDEEETKRRRLAARNRRRPAKLTSLDVLSDYSDNSDEDFKDAGWSTPSSEAISSESGQSSSSHSSDSMPLRRSLRPTKPSKRKSLADTARSKKKKRRRSPDVYTSDDSTKRKSRKSRDTTKRSRRKKRDKKELDDPEDEESVKVKSKVKYGGLSDDSKSSHDWSPAHRTRQRKYNYMEEPNTESEDEVHKPSGKHMDSSDEYKEESESGSDSDSSRRGKGKGRFFDDDIMNLQASKEAYQKQLESSGSDLLRGSLVPVVELANISPVKLDGVPSIDRVLNIETSTPNVFSNKLKNRAKRGRGFAGSPRKNININPENASILNTILTEEERQSRIDALKAKGLYKDGDVINDSDLGFVSNLENKLGEPLRIPIKPAIISQFQVEKEKKRKEKEEKSIEREKKKEERIKKKEELQIQKEQRAKEREEKKNARIANKDKIVRKVRPPEYMQGGQGQGMPWSIPIQRPPGNFSQGMPQRPPMMHPGMNIRGPMPGNPNHQLRMRMDHPNIPMHVQQLCKDGTMSPENRDPMFNYRRHPMEHLGQMRIGEPSGNEGMPYDDRKDMSMPIDHRLQTYDHMPPDGRKHFPQRMPFPGHRGMPPNMEGHHLGNRPLGPGYGENMGSSMIRGDVHVRPILNNANDNHNDFIPRNGIPISDLREHPALGRRPPSAHLDDSSSDNSGQGSSSGKRRGRGPGKKTLARQAAVNSSHEGNSPSNSPMSEGTLTVAGAPQPFRPNVDPPSVITRMPHMMPPPYRGQSMYNNSGPMYGQPRPPNHISMGGGYRPHHPHPSHIDPSPSGGGPISMTSSERNSPQNQYPPYPPAPYYPPTSTPPYPPPPPPHGRFPPHAQGPRPNSPLNPSETSEPEEKTSTANSGVTIKQEPGISIKQSLSPTEELEESAASEPQAESADEAPSNLSTAVTPAPPARPAHRQLKHTESKSERAGRGRISLTTATRYPQGPYAPQYGPYAPQPPPSDSPYLHNSLQPLQASIHQGPPQQQAPIHRPMYPHITPIQIPPRPTLTPIQSTEPPSENPPSREPIRPAAPASRAEDEPGEFGGLVSYFSSQQEDDIDT